MSRRWQEKYVVREFDRAARNYDESRLVKSYQRGTQILVTNMMKIESGMNILDLACGTGLGSIDIALKLKGTGKVIGIDLSGKMIERAKRKIPGFRYDNVEFREGSGTSLEYEDYFDYVICTNAFHHFGNKEEIFSRVRKSLKSHGTFIIQDICDDSLVMKILDAGGKIYDRAHAGSTTSEGLLKLFRATGFEEASVEKVKFNWFWRIMIGKGLKKLN
ncbi:MAG: class I SAM-dependent methyltransferase [Dehalococcoidales bacterium]|nr:class I SAM-dependent methyltransferase [Dehalococcoidales bacterium]